MKILKTKYFKPKNQLYFDHFQNSVYVQPNLDKYLTSNTPHEALLDDLLPRLYIAGDNLVIEYDLLADFEVCDDFYPITYSAEHNLCFREERCFYHPTLHLFVVGERDLSSEHGRYMHEKKVMKVTNVYYDNTESDSLERVKQLFDKYLYRFISDEAKVSILLKESHGFVFKTHRIKPYHISLDAMYNDDFLPVHQHIKDKLINDNKGLVMLHGIAGSGKTNYIKWLTSQVPSKQFIFVPTNMIGYLTDPEMMSMLVDNKNSVLVLEDCENYISQRTTDDLNTDVVSTILNIADGMLSDILECQFICTFNADISKIDDALLRQGRLIADYKFKKLTVEKVAAYLASQDVPIEQIKAIDEPKTLAELTNLNSASYKEKEVERKIGFL